jgi:hypothetical protein
MGARHRIFSSTHLGTMKNLLRHLHSDRQLDSHPGSRGGSRTRILHCELVENDELTSTMLLQEIRRCDEHPDFDFSDENEIARRFVHPREWLALDVGKFKLLRIDVRLFSSRTSQSQRTRILEYFAYGCGVQIRSRVPPRLASRPRERAGNKKIDVAANRHIPYSPGQRPPARSRP